MTTARPERPAMPPVIPGRCDSGHTACGQDARLFAAGWRCFRHTPAALAGRAEAPEPTPKETTS
jgi:hypothetical protein